MRKTADKITLIAAVLTLLVFITPAVRADLNEGLVGHWKFDEGFGSIAYDSAGTNDGTLVGDANWVAGKVGSYAVALDGDDDYVEIPDSPELKFSGEQPFSVSLWFKRAVDLSSGETLLVKGFVGDPENTNYSLHIGGVDSKIQWGWEHGSGNNDVISSGISALANQWYNVVGIWDGTRQSIYVDGAEKNSKVPEGKPDAGGNRPVVIGKALAGTSPAAYDFNGSIDDVRIYNRALSPEEIATLYWMVQDYSEFARRLTVSAMTEKIRANDIIYSAVEKELEVIDTLDYMLSSGELEGLSRRDVRRAAREISAAINSEKRVNQKLDGTIAKLKNALITLDWQPPQPVSHWKFDEGAGGTAYDSAGTNDGTLVGDANWAAGYIDGALSFDGDGDYVEIPDSPELKFSGEQPFSVSLWFKRSFDSVDGGFLLSKGFIGDPENTNYAINLSDTRSEIIWAWEYGSGINVGLYSGIWAEAGRWYNVVGVWDGTHQVIYVNGSLARATIPAGQPSLGSNRPVVIGKALAGTSPAVYDFNGSIDDVRIYNMALSDIEVQLLYYDALD